MISVPAGRFALWGVVYIPLTNTWGVSVSTLLLVKSWLHRNWALKDMFFRPAISIVGRLVYVAY